MLSWIRGGGGFPVGFFNRPSFDLVLLLARVQEEDTSGFFRILLNVPRPFGQGEDDGDFFMLLQSSHFFRC